MTLPAPARSPLAPVARSPGNSSSDVVKGHAANELVFAVVGHVGSGTTEVAKSLAEVLASSKLAGGPFDVHILKARDEITHWASAHKLDLPTVEADDLKLDQGLQDLGDRMRLSSEDHAAVARRLIKTIRHTRAARQGVAVSPDKAVVPDGAHRAYILDALRHPAEVQLLRNVYRNAFTLVGVVADREVRLRRLTKKFTNAGEKHANAFMERDSKAKERHGQRVSEAFHLADYFVDNSPDRFTSDGRANPDWDVVEQLSRLIKIITHAEVIRPMTAETAMHAAYGAQLRSACLSRQVGAALADRSGIIVATGANEVPRAGGGVYGQKFSGEAQDARCAYCLDPGCKNVKEQNEIIDELMASLPELSKITGNERDNLRERLRESRIGSLVEFSRAVHAEMDAILSAARKGVSSVGCRLFVTTFPCHPCARHIVTAGIDEVQYIEPYPKSKALKLHDDAIQTSLTPNWKPPSEGGDKLLFRPFVGVAPRMYVRAFLKDRELKANGTGALAIGEPTWEEPWQVERLSYAELEVKLDLKEAEHDEEA